MSAWPDDNDRQHAEEEPEPVSQVRPTPPSPRPVVALPSDPDSVARRAEADTLVPASERHPIASIVPLSVRVQALRPASNEAHSQPTPELDTHGRYATAGAGAGHPSELDRVRRQMGEAFRTGEHYYALIEAERVLATVPDDPEALRIAARCRPAVEQVLLAVLGGDRARFGVEAWGHQLRALQTNSRTTVLIAMIDSGFSLGEILDTCGERRFEALRTLDTLLRCGSIRHR